MEIGLHERWFAVQTRQRSEESARVNLENQGFSAYLPRFQKLRSHARRRELIGQPLFPGYIFVRLDLDADPWRSVNSTIGVRELVSSGGRPLAVPSNVIDEIRAREDDEGYVVLSSGQVFRRGERVRMIDGPFVDMEGLFWADNDNDRVLVMLNLLGRKNTVRVPRRSIVSAA